MTKKIFFIAGEPSGDALGASLIRALKTQSPEPLEIVGIGGPLMEREGLQSLLPMEELCVIGLWEVIAHLSRLMKLIQGVVYEIEKQKPDAVVTIDLPDFNFQVAKKLKKRGISKAKRIHYVAPTVWAWRPGRAKKVAQFLDGLMCLYPFEPPYFKKHKLPAKFVGHPLVEINHKPEDIAVFREQYEMPPGSEIMGLFLGSRPTELKNMSQILKDAAAVFKGEYPTMSIIIPTLPGLEYEVRNLIEGWGLDATVVSNPDYKWGAFSSCHIGLAVSGTVGLELAYLGIPHVIAYKVHPATWAGIKIMSKVKFAHLGNILAGRKIVPEFLQWNCTPVKISKGLFTLMKKPEERMKQIEAFGEIRSKLSPPDIKPSDSAAKFVLAVINRGDAKPQPKPKPKAATAA